MAQFPKPWFRQTRGIWVVQLDGKQHNLGPNREEAFARYHTLMATRITDKQSPACSDPAVVTILDSYLDWCRDYRSAATLEIYRDGFQYFLTFLKERNLTRLTASQLKPAILEEWVRSRRTWTSGNAHLQIRLIQTAMNWAVRRDVIVKSPIAFMEKPPPGRRETVISEEIYQKMLLLPRDQEFKDLLIVAWETGCRPQEIVRVEARHVDHENSRWMFPPKEAKGKKRWRVVYLNAKAMEITERYCLMYPEGPIFRTKAGKPWDHYKVAGRFRVMRRTLGKKYCLYNFRHSWATHALERGVDPLTVATLLGHANLNMLTRVYQHLDQNAAYLREAAERATK